MKHSLISQLREVEREIKMRRQVYPGLVAKRKMRQSEADHLLGLMEGVYRNLAFLYRHQETIRNAVSCGEKGGKADA